MQKTLVVNVVGLTSKYIGSNMPFVQKWSEQTQISSIDHVTPAVTCSVQATYITGKWPTEHGITGNNLFFREFCEIRNWHQSSKLVQSPKLWEVAKQQDPRFTCANIGWWFAMNGTADYVITPRPQYLADGRKMPDCYTYPLELRHHLDKKFGTFPLFDYWGPKANVRSSRYLVDAAIEVDKLHDPTLTLVYLPLLDYNTQRQGPNHESVNKDLKEMDMLLRDLITYFESKDAEIIILSEYGLTPVSQPVHINRALRKAGYIAVREERGTEILDPGTCKAFAVADHQIAHVYVNDKSKLPQVKQLLMELNGVEKVLDAQDKASYNIDHERAGDLIAIADKDSWFTYYYWLDDARAPDFARIIDIHKKPGYDPVELFADPNIKFLKPKIGFKLLKKLLGFRMLMDIIPLDATLVKGSHGRQPDDPTDRPIILSKNKRLIPNGVVSPVDVFHIILQHLNKEG